MSKEVIPIRVGEVVLLFKHLILIKHIEGQIITVNDIQEKLDAMKILSKGNDYALILDGGEALDIKDDAMTMAARHKDDHWKAFAIITRSLSDRLFANYYLYFTKPIRPTQVFTSIPGAEKWLKQFVQFEGPIKYDI